MLWVHVCLDLEYKTGKSILRRLDLAHIRFAPLGRRRPVNQAVQHMVHTEITECCTKEHRSQLPGKECLMIELMRSPLNQFNFVTQVSGIAANRFIELGVIQTFDNPLFLNRSEEHTSELQ